MMHLVNLKNRFGRRYCIQYEQSYHAQYGPKARTDDIWLLIMPCRYGHIYPFGGKMLAASVDGFPKIAGRLRRLSCVRIHQDGDAGELTVLFDMSDFAKVARIMRPRRRRRRNMTAKQRQAVGERLRRGRTKAPQTVVETQLAARPAIAEDQVGQEGAWQQRRLF